MKKIFTTMIVLFSFLLIYGQEDVIRNGGFELGVDGSNALADIADWNIDNESPGGGWWGDASNMHANLTSGDSATLYQVVEMISADSVLYDLTFDAYDGYNTGKVVVIASTSDADTSVRTILVTDSLVIGEDEMALTFGFSENSEYTGKHLIIEFTSTPLDEMEASWTDFDNVVMIKRIPGVNNPPLADAGAYQTVKGGDLVTLDGSGSSDPDDDPLTYYWISTFPGITLSDPNAVDPTFTAPDVSELSSYSFALYVNDGEVNSDTVLTNVTVTPAGELIRNGDFSMRVPGSDPSSTSLKDVMYWNIDEPGDSLGGGIWGPMVTLASADPTLYQVVDMIGAEAATYSLTMSARSSWNSHSVNTVFSVSDADSTMRTEISNQENLMGIDPDGGINTSDYATFKHVFAIPAGSEHEGKYLILEFDNIAYDDGNDDGWCEIQTVSLVKEGASGIRTEGLNKLTLYPNPATTLLYFAGSGNVSRVDIYSILGSVEKSVAGHDLTQVNVEDLTPGLYIVSLTTGQGVINYKVQIK